MSLQQGLSAFVDGARVSRDPEVFRYTLIPAIVSLGIIGSGTWFAFGYISDLGTALGNSLPDWLGFVATILVPLFYVVGLLLGVWFFSLFAVLIASPFLGNLSLAVERKTSGAAPVQQTAWWHSIREALTRELRKLGYHLPRLLAAFLLTLVPVINLAAPAIWLVFGAWTMAVQFSDYPAENRRQPFSATLERLRANRAAALGFGGCVALMLAIPLVNFVLVPVAVAGGTLLWRRLEVSAP